MADMVYVNGAMIERQFLEDNILEARRYVWQLSTELPGGDHGHCIVCNMAVTTKDTFFRFENVLLCSYCYRNFIMGNSGPNSRDTTNSGDTTPN